jgi:hypothetical protein
MPLSLALSLRERECSVFSAVLRIHVLRLFTAGINISFMTLETIQLTFVGQ